MHEADGVIFFEKHERKLIPSLPGHVPIRAAGVVLDEISCEKTESKQELARLLLHIGHNLWVEEAIPHLLGRVARLRRLADEFGALAAPKAVEALLRDMA